MIHFLHVNEGVVKVLPRNEGKRVDVIFLV